MRKNITNPLTTAERTDLYLLKDRFLTSSIFIMGLLSKIEIDSEVLD